MTDYNFWSDLFDTYQSLPDWLKALWLIVPPAFLLGQLGLVVWVFSLRSNREASRHVPAYRGGFDEHGVLHLMPVEDLGPPPLSPPPPIVIPARAETQLST